MKVLFLGPASPVLAYLRKHEAWVAHCEAPPLPDADWLVSYGYRHIIDAATLARYRAVNLHVSYLPWNRGADPNFWAWRDGTPHGVTLHVIDEGIDTGPLIAQRLVDMTDHETLRTSYAKLKAEAEEMFYATWPLIRLGYWGYWPTPQPEGGSFHRVGEMPALSWDTPCSELG